MKNTNKKLAFTLAEVLLTLTVLGILFAITTPVLKTALPNFNTYRVKKINTTLKNTIDFMLNRNIQYEGQHDFSNTGLMVSGTEYVANVRTFREVFLSVVDMKESFECYAYGANRNIKCYASVDNMVWAIPDTDFVSLENGSVIVTVENKDGYGTSNYLPITVYPDYKAKKAKADPSGYMLNNAVIYGVRRDGRVIFLENVIDCENNPKSMQCFAMKEVADSKMKRR